MTSLAQIQLEEIEGRSGTAGVHGILAWALFACVVAAAIPFGSNRPFFWAFWPFVIAAIGCLYSLALQVSGRSFRIETARIRVELILYLAVCGYLLAQLVPLGQLGWAPPSIETRSGLALPTNTISVVPGETMLMLQRWFGYGLLFFLTLQVARNARRRLQLLRAISAAGTLYAVLAILAFQWGNTILGFEKWAYLASVTGTFVNRNSFATFMAICLAVTLSLLVETMVDNRRDATRRGTVLLYAASALLILAAILGSNSRMGLAVSLLGAATVIALAVIKRAVERRREVVLVAGMAVIGIAFVSTLYSGDLWARFLELETASQVRLDLYRQVWGMVLERPWLGFGGGTFEQAYQVFHRPPVNADVVWDRAHNTYLTLWSELGLVFGSLPLLLVASLAWRTVGALRASPSPDATIPAWISTIIVAAAHSMVDFSLEIYANALLFTFLAALATAASLRGRS